jgi:hypothetical protein
MDKHAQSRTILQTENKYQPASMPFELEKNDMKNETYGIGMYGEQCCVLSLRWPQPDHNIRAWEHRTFRQGQMARPLKTRRAATDINQLRGEPLCKRQICSVDLKRQEGSSND